MHRHVCRHAQTLQEKLYITAELTPRLGTVKISVDMLLEMDLQDGNIVEARSVWTCFQTSIYRHVFRHVLRHVFRHGFE